MGWLSSANQASIAALCGVPLTHPAFAAGVVCAEGLIDRFTKAVFGSSRVEVLLVTLQAKSTFLPLPGDVAVVSSVAFQGKTLASVYGAGVTTLISAGSRLELMDALDSNLVWGVGGYRVTVTRGYATVPGDVLKAASLLVAWYCDLSDPERSRYDNLGMGDFSGTMRQSDFPVPEARALLDAYRTAVRGSM